MGGQGAHWHFFGAQLQSAQLTLVPKAVATSAAKATIHARQSMRHFLWVNQMMVIEAGHHIQAHRRPLPMILRHPLRWLFRQAASEKEEKWELPERGTSIGGRVSPVHPFNVPAHQFEPSLTTETRPP
ncbi:hypothetical protein C5Y97_22210 [Blastopirellula marina]|uniref:Uncharacterized protein n=1 Tax=Blastopirellula marina TaxID=124 RepID=A0A2S8FCS5_9BACT|nr:hypothetical protein C5Y98_22200 [Blastopirellula marina]PTL42444.1 hypothetical protein C5Y97_22210 [Blastopirellula marina]